MKTKTILMAYTPHFGIEKFDFIFSPNEKHMELYIDSKKVENAYLANCYTFYKYDLEKQAGNLLNFYSELTEEITERKKKDIEEEAYKQYEEYDFDFDVPLIVKFGTEDILESRHIEKDLEEEIDKYLNSNPDKDFSNSIRKIIKL